MAQYQHTSTCQVTLRVTVQCEGCDHIFDYDTLVTSASSRDGGKSNTLIVLDNTRRAEEGLRDRLHDISRGDYSSLGIHKCPQCKYLQSYMAINKKKDNGVAALSCLGSIVFLVLLYALFRKNTESDWVLALFSLLVRVASPIIAAALAVGFACSAFGYFSRPNRAWLRKHKHSSAPMTRNPLKITVAE